LPQNNVVVLGRINYNNNSTGLVVGIDQIINHIGYNNQQKNDIALLKLSQDVEEDPDNFIQYLYLQPSVISINTIVWANGFGQTPQLPYSERLMKVQVPIVPNANCYVNGAFYQPEMLCAGAARGQDTCVGDSGSTLVYKNSAISSRWIGVGITSFGGLPCGGSGVLGTYTNVSNYISWIKVQIPDWEQPENPSRPVPTISPSPFDPEDPEDTSAPEEYDSDATIFNLIYKAFYYLLFGLRYSK